MKYTRPFDLVTGAESANQEWLNANLPQGFEGSIPPAEFYDRVNQEITNAIVAVGLTPTNTDLGQLAQAIILGHRLLENRIIYVPGDFDDIFQALSYLSGKIIPDDVFVTILNGAGDIEVNATTGPIILDQPYGSRIRIQGQPLTGTGFPLANEINIAAKPTVEALLRARFPTRIVVSGAVRAIFMKSGMFSQLSRLCIIGDGTAGQDGLCIGEWQGDIGTGNIGLRDFYAFNCGGTGIRANYAAAIQGYNVAGTHCSNGYNSANGSSIQVGGTVHGIRNSAVGATIRDQGFMELINGAVASFKNNSGNGIWSNETGSFQALGAASLDIQSNAGAGILTSWQSYSTTNANTTGGGNASGDVVTQNGSTCRVASSSGLTLSPAAGTVGNNNSVNLVG